MLRREFIRTSSVLAAGAGLGLRGEPIIGHGDFRYRINLNWGKLDPAQYPVNDCHEMAMDKRGRIFLLTNETRNNVLIYNKDGKLLNVWGIEFPGAHGLTLCDEGGEEFLYIADYDRHEVIKTTLEGRVVRVFAYPADSGKYAAAGEFLPTETAVAPNGDVYVADGYGKDYIVRYDAGGRVKQLFGGPGDGPAFLKNAHGVALDTRPATGPELLVTSRVENAVKRFSLEGEFLETIHLPGAYICRPVVHGEQLYFAVLITRLPWDSGSGMICILDKNNRVVSCPAGNTPRYDVAGKLEPLYQTIKVFRHPHDVLVDGDQNIYVAQWNSGKVYPARLERV